MSPARDAGTRRYSVIAMVAASCMMAHQLAAKATRDGFFLAQFPAAQLPNAVIAAALLSIVLALWSPRLLQRWGPAAVIPPAFALSALIHGAEWICQTSWPRITSAAIYLHVAGFGAILLSGFWLLLSELFDPHEAKRRFGQVAGAGTAGGVAGGIAAERLVHWFGASALLLLLAGLHLLCAVLLHRLRPEGATPVKQPVHQKPSLRAAFRTPLL